MLKGDYFGERSLLSSENRSATVIALQKVQCIIVGKEVFNFMIN